MVKIFKKKPVLVSSVQWEGTHESAETISKLFPELKTNCFSYSMDINHKNPLSWTIYTLEGLIEVSPGDWIIQGVKGEFYPCKPDIFELTYEEVQ